jgi:hypothetical protein
MGKIQLAGLRWVLGAAVGLALPALATAAQTAQTTAPGTTRGFVIGWFDVALYFDKDGKDCPKGNNPGPEIYYRRELTRIGWSQAQIDAYMKTFLDLSKYAQNAPVVQMRGRIDGKPADVYANPTSVPDPHILVVEGKNGYGFDLDGKNKPGDFVDPATGQPGVDNRLYKVIGCLSELKPHAAGEHAPLTQSYRNVVIEQMPALLVEITGLDDAANDDDVTVNFYRATEPLTLQSGNVPMPGLTFRIDGNPRWHGTAHGRIKDGVLTTDPFDLTMASDPFLQQEYQFSQARLRATFDAKGNLKALLGGYMPWWPFYFKYASGTWGVEATNNVDLPGLYYALRREADFDPDPKTGENRAISASYDIDAAPAFLIHPDEQGPKRSASLAGERR